MLAIKRKAGLDTGTLESVVLVKSREASIYALRLGIHGDDECSEAL